LDRGITEGISEEMIKMGDWEKAWGKEILLSEIWEAEEAIKKAQEKLENLKKMVESWDC